MNAAFLLLTTAWMTGADPAPAAAPPAAAAPVVIAGSGCGGGCGATCGDPCAKPSLCERFKALFHRDHCGCKETCAPACKPACHRAPVCKPVCAPKPVCHAAPICHPAPICRPAPVCHPAPVCKPVCKPTCAPACADPCAKPSLCERFKALFHKHGHCGCEAACGGCGSVTPAPVAPGTPETPKKMPTTIGSNGVIITPAKIGIENNNPFDLHRRYEGRVSRSADFSTITGQLIYVHADGGRWVLRFAPISKEERFGGSVVLARDVKMDAFTEGDLVTVDGDILSEKASFPLGGALYRASKVTLVEKGTHDISKTD